MLKYFTLALMVSAAALICHAQNLVPNPSFEEYLECPQSTAELHLQAVNWHTWNLSPDFFHECNNIGLGTAGVPANAWGYQWPITGLAYAGVYTYAEYLENAREYMAAPLNEPLVQGSTYYMMFHASMYDGGAKDVRWCANSNIGMRFFKDPDYDPFPPAWNPFVPDNFAHLNYGEILDDYTNWTLIEGWFTADDTYNWVAIGNFFTDDQTDILILNDEGSCSGIYYIENICVAPSPEECEYLLSVQSKSPAFTPTLCPNPARESIRISFPESKLFDVAIYDTSGRMIKGVNNIRSGQQIDVSTFQKGVYVVRAFNNHNSHSFKFVKQ